MAHGAGRSLTLNVGPSFVALSVSALRSHRDAIGNLRIECVSGCNCTAVEYEGHWDITANVMYQMCTAREAEGPGAATGGVWWGGSHDLAVTSPFP